MSKKEKLLQRFLNQPKDFTFDELISLLGYFGFTSNNKGKTSGSRIEFENIELGLKYLAYKGTRPKMVVEVVSSEVVLFEDEKGELILLKDENQEEYYASVIEYKLDKVLNV